MQASLRALVADILDYAGLFPPAELALDVAIRNYARYQRQREAWMLARFICPASRLTELAPYVDELFSPDLKLRVSVLGRGGATQEQFLEASGRDLDDISAFRERYPASASVEAFETRLPDGITTKDDAMELFRVAANKWSTRGIARFPMFYEPPLKTEWRSTWPAIMQGLAQLEKEAAPAGFKLRCGGLGPSAYPSIEQVASVLTWGTAHHVPLKFTAGLHHPLRHYNETARTDMHGFINVFAGGVLLANDKVDQGAVCRILALTNDGGFDFTADGLSVDGLHITTDEIIRVRRRAVTSFGSCSFDEPVDDLEKLGWL